MSSDSPAKGKWGGPRPAPRFGYCPVCFKERGYTVNYEMRPHRMWMSGFPGHEYGYMKPCLGTGMKPLPGLPLN